MSVGEQDSICCQVALWLWVKRLQHHLLAKRQVKNRYKCVQRVGICVAHPAFTHLSSLLIIRTDIVCD